MSTKLTKAQLSVELARVTQERDDAVIALEAAQRTIAALEGRQPAGRQLRPQPKLVELHREPTRQGDLLRAGEALYRATITERDDGKGYQVVAPNPHGKPLVTTLNADGVGFLPEYALHKLMRA